MCKKLNNPPVVMALFQLKLDGFDFDRFGEYDKVIKNNFPNRHDNIQVGINLDSSALPLGKTRISGTSNAKVGSYLYYTNDQKKKLEVSNDTLTFIDESNYTCWNDFKLRVFDQLYMIKPLLEQVKIIRTSIRFINRFEFPDFDNPNDYINTIITESTENKAGFPLRQYGFRLVMDIPDTDIYSIVNHNVESIPSNSYLYTLDIDVLDRQQLLFNLNTISESIEKLREIKNKIFFDTITEKTETLCN